MAEQALGALKWMKAGLNAEKSRDKMKGKVRKMSALYFSSTNKRKKLEQPQWVKVQTCAYCACVVHMQTHFTTLCL